MPFINADCIRCGASRTRHEMCAEIKLDIFEWEVCVICDNCGRPSIYGVRLSSASQPSQFDDSNLKYQGAIKPVAALYVS